MGYARKYHLKGWLTPDEERLLGKDNMLVLSHAFAQYSEAFDALSTQEAGRYNGLPVEFVVANLCQLLGLPELQKIPIYGRRTNIHYHRIWRLIRQRVRKNQSRSAIQSDTKHLVRPFAPIVKVLEFAIITKALFESVSHGINVRHFV